MLRNSFHLLLLLTFLAPASAQDTEYFFLNIPAELKENAHSVVREYTYHWEVQSDRTATIRCRKVVTLLDDNHDHEDRLVVHYDGSSKITSMKAVAYDAFGNKIRSAGKSDIEDIRATGDNFDSDARVQTVKLSNPTYPYTVEFEYTEKVSDFSMVAGFPYFLPMDYFQSVQSAEMIAVVPNDNALRYWSNDLPEPTVTKGDKETTHTWTLKNAPARRFEAAAPPFTRNMPFLRVTLDHFRVDRYEGSMATWNDFGLFMGKLLDGRDELPEGLRAAVIERTKGLTTEREKIDALYRLMQERTRYVSVQLGIGGWQPFPAEYVERNKFGDCKALSNYMGAMLKEIGIESYPVLVNWNDRQFFPAEKDFTASSFNHMILYVPSEDMYLECTSSDLPPGYLGEGKEGRNVLWVTPEGGQLVMTPTSTAADNGRLRTVDVVVRPDGSAEYAIRSSMHGALHDYYRSLLTYEADRGKQLERLQGYEDIPDVSGTNYHLSVLPNEPVARLEYSTVLNSYANSRGSRMFLPVNKFDNYNYVPDNIEERRTPIQSSHARFYIDTINITLPPEMEVESLGDEKIEFRHAAGEYVQTVAVREANVQMVRTLKVLPVDLPAEEYDAYRQFFVDVAKAENRRIVLRERKTK